MEERNTAVPSAAEGNENDERDLKLVFRLQDAIQDDVVERALLRRGWIRFEMPVAADETGLVVPPSPGGNGLVDHNNKSIGVNGPNCKYNLHFKRGRFTKTEFADATRPLAALESNRLRINHFNESVLITHKGKLLRLMKKLRVLHGAIFNFAPEGYILPSEYTKFTKAYSKYRDEGACWIVKPQGLSQGQGISLVRDLSDLKYDCESVIQR